MRRILAILALLALSAYAVDCIRAKFDIFVAQYEALNDNYTGLIIDSTSSDNTLEKFTFSNDHTYLWTSYARLSPNSEFKKYEPQQMSYKAEISQEGDFKIYDRGPLVYRVFHTEDSIYVEKLSNEHSDTTIIIWHIRNDTLYEKTSSTLIVTYDPGFENRCFETRTNNSSYEVLYEYETKGDTLIEYYGALLGNVGYPSANSKATDSIWTKTFYVPFNTEQPLGIFRTPRPTNISKKGRHFDLLGRPARGKYTVMFSR